MFKAQRRQILVLLPIKSINNVLDQKKSVTSGKCDKCCRAVVNFETFSFKFFKWTLLTKLMAVTKYSQRTVHPCSSAEGHYQPIVPVRRKYPDGYVVVVRKNFSANRQVSLKLNNWNCIKIVHVLRGFVCFLFQILYLAFMAFASKSGK